jgi:hypothetical protein
MKIGGASAPLVDPTNDLSASVPSFHPFTERLGSEGLPVHACACDVADEAEMAAWAGDRLRQVDNSRKLRRNGPTGIINFASQLAYKGAPASHIIARPRPASDAGAFYAGQTLSPNGGDVMV